MKVLHVGKHYPPFMGGIETHLRALAEGTADRADVEVVVANSTSETVVDRVGPIQVKRLKQHFSFRRAPICLGFATAIREARPDIVHLHLPNPVAVLALLWSGYSGPLIVTYHSDVVRQRLLARFFEPILRLLLRRSDVILATSAEYASSSPTLRAFASKCRVVPYGIDTAPFAEPAKEAVAAIRKKYGDRIVLAVGRLIYYKGFGFLIDAMQRVNGHLLVIGDGGLRDALTAQAAALGISDRVTFLGELQNEETAQYYHAASMFVLPSIARSEAFGIVQIEAMAAGRPVINTSLDSGVPSVSVNGTTGITVIPESSADLTDAINFLFENPEHALLLGEAGRRRVADKFTASRMCDATLELYSDIAVSARGKTRRLRPVGPRAFAHTS
ncbi:MAG: glycosyltransferase [Gemmatimonadaceae bacterium]